MNAKRLELIEQRWAEHKKNYKGKVYLPEVGAEITVIRDEVEDLCAALRVAVEALKLIHEEGDEGEFACDYAKNTLKTIGWEEAPKVNKCKCCGETIAHQVEYCLVCSGECDGHDVKEEEE